MPQLRSFGDSVMVSLTQGLSVLMTFIPVLLGALVVLTVGWLISSVLAKLIEKGLVALGLERVVLRIGADTFLKRTGIFWSMSQIVAELSKWFVRLIFVQAAANILGMPQVTAVINSIILYIPNIVVAMILVVIGALIAGFLAGLVRAAITERQWTSPNLLASITYYAVISFSFVAAMNQLGIAAIIVNTLFIGLVASLVLSVGLAFGLGGQSVASKIADSWYSKVKGEILLRSTKLEGNDKKNQDVSPLKKTGT